MMRNIILLFSLFLTLSIHSQTEHMRFAGIPLCGTIEHFQAQLERKGFVPQRLLNKQLAVGKRVFKGVFAGKKGNVVVYYDAKDKEVYGAKVFYDGYTKQMAIEELEHLEDLLAMKYGQENVEETTDNNDNSTFTVTAPLGVILCYLRWNEDLTDYPYHWSTHVEFVDSAGNAHHNFHVLDDF